MSVNELAAAGVVLGELRLSPRLGAMKYNDGTSLSENGTFHHPDQHR